MKIERRILVPIGILAAGAFGIAVIVALRPKAEPVAAPVPAPLVRVERVAPRAVDFAVRAHGTVTPRTESDVVPEVSGPVVWVSPAFASGGFFESGEPLVRIERDDYEVELEVARAAVARTQSEYDRATLELTRQERLAEQSVASKARYDDAANAKRTAAAALREAKSKIERAERNLERTEIVAPYAGRVREESVDAGQFVTRGSPIGRIYAVDYAEVRLPIPDADLRYLDLPMLYRGESPGSEGPEVLLRARFAGEEHAWTGRIVRTEGEIDPKSRMVTVVARIDDPYGRAQGADAGPERPPLAVGLFVDAEIQGERVERAVVLPRTALRGTDRVVVVDAEERMHFRDVEVLRSDGDSVVIGAGLAAGEDVVVSPLSGAVDGMKVRVARDEPDQAGLAGEATSGGSGGRLAADRLP